MLWTCSVASPALSRMRSTFAPDPFTSLASHQGASLAATMLLWCFSIFLFGDRYIDHAIDGVKSHCFYCPRARQATPLPGRLLAPRLGRRRVAGELLSSRHCRHRACLPGSRNYCADATGSPRPMTHGTSKARSLPLPERSGGKLARRGSRARARKIRLMAPGIRVPFFLSSFKRDADAGPFLCSRQGRPGPTGPGRPCLPHLVKGHFKMHDTDVGPLG